MGSETEQETWHDTAWQGYQVSNLGRVRSLPRQVPMVALMGKRRDRRVGRTRRVKGRVLKLRHNGSGCYACRVGGRVRTLKQIMESAGIDYAPPIKN